MQSFRLGSIFDFEIRVDLSWFIIFFLILWTLIFNIFPANFPELSTTAYAIMGVIGTILFFTSLLAHELSHSLVAKMKRIPIEGITLFVFGGVSRTRMDAESPGDEFQIAVVGPLMSLFLAALFGLIWWVGQNAGWTVAVTGVARYLATINLVIAIFNLLPGFPLDGGRLFRSVIWKTTGNLRKATRIAAGAGKFFGFALIAFGIIRMFGGSILGGLWLVFIGWFLTTAAELGYKEQLLQSSLKGVKAKQLMTPAPQTVPSSLSLQEVVDQYFLQQRYQAFPVTENNHPVGIITLNQVKDVPRKEWEDRTVQETMTPAKNNVTTSPEEDMSQVLEKMENSGIQRVLVTDNGNLEGIITGRDLSVWLQRKQELEKH
jgi:Zn-dependent protease/CBS domain-containing protein